MKKVLLIVFGYWMLVAGASAQTVSQRVQKAFGQFEADSQLRHAISSLYIIDANTGEVVFDKNSQIGLAGASTQKIITATTAFELLGKDYRYKTSFLNGREHLYVMGSGDPTFGSWRYKETVDTVIFKSVIDAYKQYGGLKPYDVALIDNENLKKIPSGWIYEDIGNYYGAAAQNLNWHENQYDINFLPGENEGSATTLDTVDQSSWRKLINNSRSGKKGSGDNAYVYFLPADEHAFIQGTVPAGVKKFKIAATDAHPEFSFYTSFQSFACSRNLLCGDTNYIVSQPIPSPKVRSALENPIYIHYSPTLDSITYWFLKKSINLYGEALIRTFAKTEDGIGTTDSGISIVKNFWKEKGLDPEELNIYDGSGLSPMNRITTHAQVEILKFAKTRPWFSSFYYALPEYNGMKMKSGTIGDVKGFCGYQKSKDGHEYIFSFLVNNYNGRTSAVVNKMYKVLDELK